LFCRIASLLGHCCSRDQIASKERGQPVKRNEVDAIVEIDVTGAGHNDQLLAVTGKPVGLFADVISWWILSPTPAVRHPGSRRR
jgi:hypothetical protein